MNNIFGSSLVAIKLDELIKEKLDTYQKRKLMRLYHTSNNE